MCHPGHPDEPLLSGSSYARERERELSLLCDPEARAFVAEQGIVLIAFRDL
jgi:predicted glycoside hydrolase/deacetylase ChbG (UPF0249 family)